MMSILQRIFPQRWDPVRAAVAGFLATAAYSIVMEGDQSLTGNRFSDVRFIQGLLERQPAPQKKFPLLAWIIHFLNGILLAEGYAVIFKRLLPGPNWLRGAIFGELFIVSAWWLTPLADKYHPLIKSGELPQLAKWSSFFQNIVRHLVFGLVLGILYKE